jgi:hypothetical protein
MGLVPSAERVGVDRSFDLQAANFMPRPGQRVSAVIMLPAGALDQEHRSISLPALREPSDGGRSRCGDAGPRTEGEMRDLPGQFSAGVFCKNRAVASACRGQRWVLRISRSKVRPALMAGGAGYAVSIGAARRRPSSSNSMTSVTVSAARMLNSSK